MNTIKIFLQRKSIFAATLLLCIIVSLFAAVSVSLADNPIIQTIYTADPSPLVHNGRVYLYTGHDEDNSTYFTMNEWRVWSSADMVNWTDHGSPLRYNTFSWATGDAWAGQAIYRNGKFYWYVPVKHTNGSTAIGVAVSTSPTGPFTDARGTPLVGPAYGYIDPTVFIDDDGQAYLYWGNPGLWYVRLNADMISYSGTVTQIPLTTAGFGTRSGNPDRATLYEEGPWVYKRSGTYYMVFAADCCTNGEYIAYSTSSSPTGPWTYRGVIMPKQGSSFTNHAGITDFNGNSYFFYHNGALPGGGGFTRSVAVEKFTYNSNGTFPTINMSTSGAPQVGTLNPYVLNEAESMAWASGVETEVSSEGGMNVGFIDNGDYVKVKGVNFGSGAASFETRVASATSGGNIELRLDSSTGTLVGTCSIQGTGGWQTWVTRTCTVSGATGTHDLYLKFTGGSGSLFNINWWKFYPTGGVTATPTRTPIPGSTATRTATPLSSTNFLTNADMEAGTTGWVVNGAGTLSSDTTQFHGGARSVKITGRTSTWNGIGQNVAVSNFPTSGQNVTVSVWVRSQSGTPTARATLRLTASTTTYVTLASATVNSTGWTQLTGTVPVSWSGTLTGVLFYVETAAGTDNLYIDDASLRR